MNEVRYPCCEHCPKLHREGLFANLGHDYPCRDIHCPGSVRAENEWPQEAALEEERPLPDYCRLPACGCNGERHSM